jgi:hypothetical protein
MTIQADAIPSYMAATVMTPRLLPARQNWG